ncbi:MAG: PAS domain S-box protein [Methanomicrobia archaeon]|nr:PAS domain S-box protein [Methanomicrobia archaeon]
MSNTGKKAPTKLDIPTAGMDKVTLLVLFILAFLFLMVFVPLSSAEDAAGAGRTILVGTYENSPKIYTDEQGNTVGLFPDLLAYIADSEGWEIQYVHGTWTENLERLERNEIDIMPDMAYSDERAEIYAFNNESVLINWGILYTKKDSEIQSIPDLQGKRVAVMNGSIHTVGEAGIIKLVEQFDVDCTFIGVDDYTEVFRLLDTGEADAGVVNRLFGALHEQEFDVEKTNVVFEPVDLKFAFSKNSTLSGLLIERIDYHLLAMKKDPDSIYYQTVEKYLFVPEEMRIPDWVVPAFFGLLGLVALFLLMSAVLKWQVNARTADLRATTEDLEQDVIERKKAEEKLQESEEKYRALVENANEVIVVAQEGVLKFANPKAVEITGYSAEELQNKPFVELIHPDDRAMVVERHRKRLKGEAILGIYPFRIVTKGGKTKWVEINAVLITWEGRPATLNFISDITERKRMEEEIRLSEVLYRTIFESTSAPTVIVGEDTTLVLVNEEFAKLAGYSKDELEGKKSWTEFVVKEDLERMKKHHYARRENASSAPGQYEFRFLDRYGNVQDIYLTIAMILGTKRSVASFMVITERKQAEAALLDALKKREELEEIVNNSPAIVFLWRAAEGWPVEFVSDNIRQWGYTPVDFYSGDVPYASIVYPPDLERVASEVDRYSQEGRTEFVQEYRIITKTGEIRWLEDRTWIRRDAGGVITHYQGIALDITERKRVEETLQESEEKYRNLVERANDGIGILQDGVVKYANQRLLAMGDYSTVELIGAPFTTFIDPNEIPEVVDRYERRFAGEEVPQLYETVLRAKDGRKIYVEFNAGLSTYEGKPADLLFVRDITERKRAEEERESLIKELEMRNVEMERFVYTISHELRTPLVTLQGYADLLREDVERNEERHVETDLTFIENAVTSMGLLLEDTLALSRTGRVLNPPEDVPFGVLIRDALARLTDQIKLSGVEISVAENFPIGHVDRMRAVEVLVNLIENGINFMGDQPYPKIEIGYRLDGEETVFFVKDNGMGLDKSQHEKVFELFYKVDRSGKGTGAGLAIVKRIIEVHGGRIWVESELGKGCTVCFTLPIR